MDRPKKILIIDDSEIMLARARRVLVEEGYEVVTTTQAVGNARYLPTCDLILIDFHMPGIDGQAVLQSLRSFTDAAKNSCPFYLYTSDAALVSKHAELGFDGVILNKGDESAFKQQVRAIFRMAQVRRLKEKK